METKEEVIETKTPAKKPRRLTIKQQAWISEVVKTKNGTEAAARVYDVKDRRMAKNIASENMAKPYLVEELTKIMKGAGYNPIQSVKRLISTAEEGVGKKATASDQIRADELLLKLNNNLIEKSQHISLSMNLDNMNKDSLMKLKEKYDKLINSE